MKNKNLFIILYCLCLLVGGVYITFKHCETSFFPDTKSYLKMAQGNFNVLLVHRYRLILPTMVGVISFPFIELSDALQMSISKQQIIRIVFCLVNLSIMSFWGLLIYKICRVSSATVTSSLLATSVVVCSKWSIYLASIPMVDSFYLVVVSMVYYGIISKNKALLIVTIFLGPFAKESFIFIAPLIIIFSKNVIPLKKQIMLFTLSGILVFSWRLLLDHLINIPSEESLSNAFSHIENIGLAIKTLLSLKGLLILFSVWGMGWIIILIGLKGGINVAKKWFPSVGLSFALIVSVFIHVILSVEIGRMTFLLSCVFAASIARILDFHPSFQFYRHLLNNANGLK